MFHWRFQWSASLQSKVRVEDVHAENEKQKSSNFFSSSEGASFSARSFGELNLSRPLCHACEALGYKQPTPIQVCFNVSSSDKVSVSWCTMFIIYRFGYWIRNVEGIVLWYFPQKNGLWFLESMRKRFIFNISFATFRLLFWQAACIPLALTGRDICGSAVTGSGKVSIHQSC